MMTVAMVPATQASTCYLSGSCAAPACEQTCESYGYGKEWPENPADPECDEIIPSECSSIPNYRCDSNCKKVYDTNCGGCNSDADCTDSTKPLCYKELGETTGVCVECLENDITYGDTNTNNDRSNVCMAMYGDVKPVCGADFKCRAPFPCSINADCLPNECCTKEINPDPLAEGVCKSVGTVNQPYLCTR